MKLLGIDRYLLGLTVGPMVAVLTSTMMAFLMERVLRSLDELAQVNNGFGYLMQLVVDLTPHYVGLTLPAAFFIALFVVVNRLNGQSEIDAMLATGMSLDRILRPFLWLGVGMMIFSIALYGFLQPYSRYAYRAVMHAARDAGWNGEVRPRALLMPTSDFLLTADEVDASGLRLDGVFLRMVTKEGVEEVLTATSAQLSRHTDGKSVVLKLRDGQQVSTGAEGFEHMLAFSDFTMKLPLAPAAKLLRNRGVGEENELTLFELARFGYGKSEPTIPRQALLAEFYSRLARALALALMPLLAAPLGVTAKRTGSGAPIFVAGLLLFAFQTSLIFGQGLAAKGILSAAVAQGLPFTLFATACIWVYLSSRKFPGENPVNWVIGMIDDGFVAIAARFRSKAA
jgi:lipopolysaccharide export system permease protein